MGDTGIPASITVDGRIGEDGFSSVMAGISLYFGGEDKSLIRRHREDDPRLRFFDIFNAGVLGSDKIGGGELGEEPCDPECTSPPPPESPPPSPPPPSPPPPSPPPY
jgi:hypothetical protein